MKDDVDLLNEKTEVQQMEIERLQDMVKDLRAACEEKQEIINADRTIIADLRGQFDRCADVCNKNTDTMLNQKETIERLREDAERLNWVIEHYVPTRMASRKGIDAAMEGE